MAQLVAVPAALLTALLAARWGNWRTTIGAVLGVVLGLLMMVLPPSWSAAEAGFMLMIVMASIRRPVMPVFTMQIVKPGRQPSRLDAHTMAVGLSWFVTALLGGVVIAVLGYGSRFLVGMP